MIAPSVQAAKSSNGICSARCGLRLTKLKHSDYSGSVLGSTMKRLIQQKHLVQQTTRAGSSPDPWDQWNPHT